MQTKELELRCPFCGDAGIIYRRLDCCWLAECRDDSCVAGSSAQAYDTEAEALAAWNTRLPTSSGGRGEAWRPDRGAVTLPDWCAADILRYCDAKRQHLDAVLIPIGSINWLRPPAPLPTSPSQERCEDLVEASQSLRSVPQSALPEADDHASGGAE